LSQGPAPFPEGSLADALSHHQAGRLTETERIYLQLLAIDTHHADSLHLLGMIAYRDGRHEVAVEMIRSAIAAGNWRLAVEKGNGALYLASTRHASAICEERPERKGHTCRSIVVHQIQFGTGGLNHADQQHLKRHDASHGVGRYTSSIQNRHFLIFFGGTANDAGSFLYLLHARQNLNILRGRLANNTRSFPRQLRGCSGSDVCVFSVLI
jgi:hypothetical protein